jgi:hypothetical protein
MTAGRQWSNCATKAHFYPESARPTGSRCAADVTGSSRIGHSPPRSQKRHAGAAEVPPPGA